MNEEKFKEEFDKVLQILSEVKRGRYYNMREDNLEMFARAMWMSGMEDVYQKK